MKYKALFADLTHMGMGINADVFPLGIALVAAYTVQELKNEIEIEIHKFPQELSESLRREPPQILCMSHYMWNSRLTYAYAECVKRSNPNTIIIFGGPDFPLPQNERKEFLLNRPAIDFYIKWDGEHAFVQLVKDLVQKRMDVRLYKSHCEVSANVCFLTEDQNYVEGPNARIQDLMTVPSPYTMGLLDKFFEYPLMPIFETTRGCPYLCTFCNDGSELRNKVYCKHTEFIHDELNYIASKGPKSSELCFADLNFGMYKHDIETAKILQAIRRRYEWPDRMQGSMGKSQPQRLVEVANIINEGNLGILKLGSSLQSTDSEVLKAVKRTNLSVDKLRGMRKHKNTEDSDKLQDYTELIVPLPQQTIRKHFNSLRDAIDVLGMNNIDVHQLTMLRGSQMAVRSERELYECDIRYRVLVGSLGVYEIGGEDVPISEIEETVVANSTMPFDDYIECRVMSLLVKIYIDNDPFKEIFGLVRFLGLSAFEVLLKLREQHLKVFESLEDLVVAFINGTKNKLFEHLGDLEQMITKVENIDRFISGELGQNELLTYRALVYRDHYDDLSNALRITILEYIKANHLMNGDIQDYVEDAFLFCALRRFDLDSIDIPKEGSFRFGFVEAEEKNFQVDPKERRGDTKYEFYHGDDDLKVIKSQIKRWGTDTLHQLGKFMQKTNALRMRRRVRQI